MLSAAALDSLPLVGACGGGKEFAAPANRVLAPIGTSRPPFFNRIGYWSGFRPTPIVWLCAFTIGRYGAKARSRAPSTRHARDDIARMMCSTRPEIALFARRSGHDEFIHVLFEFGAIHRPIGFVVAGNTIISQAEQHVRVNETSLVQLQ